MNRGRHKKKNSLKELLKRISNNKQYEPFALCYKRSILVSKTKIYLSGITDEKIITTWFNTLKCCDYDKVIIDNLTFII